MGEIKMTGVNASVSCATAAYLSQQMTANDVNVKDVLINTDLQRQYLVLKRAECDCQMETEPKVLEGVYCPRVWDNVMCWNDTAVATTATQGCPFYINKFTTNGFASRMCLPNGTWFSNDVIKNAGSTGWTNFTDCFSNPVPTHPSLEVPALLVKHLLEFRIMYNVGYGLSLVLLIFAMIIMIYFKKLHCSRNFIHMNLFVSFMFRASMNLIRDNLLVRGVGFPKDLTFNDSGGVIQFNDGPHWECRLFFAVFQYAIFASYIWIFVEAVYIFVLIFVSVFSEKVKVMWFMLIGWSVPLVFVLIWSIARLTLDNTLCWNTTKNMPGLTWILQGPVMLTIVINFIFFIALVWVLYTKLSASPMVKKKYRKLARSTLFLIPVFGVYYIVFTLPLHDLSDNMASVMLFMEMFFNSYQGVFIAVVLCFINAEVRTEIRKAWANRGLRRGSVTSAAFRSSKLKAKRETLAVGDNTDYEMPIVVVENGTTAVAITDCSEEEQPFLELPSDRDQTSTTNNDTKPTKNNTTTNGVATFGKSVTENDRDSDRDSIRYCDRDYVGGGGRICDRDCVRDCDINCDRDSGDRDHDVSEEQDSSSLNSLNAEIMGGSISEDCDTTDNNNDKELHQELQLNTSRLQNNRSC